VSESAWRGRSALYALPAVQTGSAEFAEPGKGAGLDKALREWSGRACHAASLSMSLSSRCRAA
jgi:hypothetical protein